MQSFSSLRKTTKAQMSDGFSSCSGHLELPTYFPGVQERFGDWDLRRTLVFVTVFADQNVSTWFHMVPTVAEGQGVLMKFKECRISPNSSLPPVKRVQASPPKHGMFPIHETRFFIPRRLSN